MKQALDAEMTEEEAARMEKSGMGTGMGGINAGEEQLFGALAAMLNRTVALTQLLQPCVALGKPPEGISAPTPTICGQQKRS